MKCSRIASFVSQYFKIVLSLHDLCNGMVLHYILLRMKCLEIIVYDEVTVVLSYFASLVRSDTQLVEFWRYALLFPQFGIKK